MKKAILLSTFIVVIMATPQASGQSINNMNTYCNTNGGGGSHTTVYWSTSSGEPNNVGVFVTADSGVPTLQAAARSGSSYCPWIELNVSYVWDLYDGLDSSDDLPSGLGGSGPGNWGDRTLLECVGL